MIKQCGIVLRGSSPLIFLPSTNFMRPKLHLKLKCRWLDINGWIHGSRKINFFPMPCQKLFRDQLRIITTDKRGLTEPEAGLLISNKRKNQESLARDLHATFACTAWYFATSINMLKTTTDLVSGYWILRSRQSDLNKRLAAGLTNEGSDFESR
jgi:hypothetical protein